MQFIEIIEILKYFVKFMNRASCKTVCVCDSLSSTVHFSIFASSTRTVYKFFAVFDIQWFYCMFLFVEFCCIFWLDIWVVTSVFFVSSLDLLFFFQIWMWVTCPN